MNKEKMEMVYMVYFCFLTEIKMVVLKKRGGDGKSKLIYTSDCKKVKG